MAGVHFKRSAEDTNVVLAWYQARDTLLGRMCVKQDIKRGFELAALCKHPEAVWLTSLFAGCVVHTTEEAIEVLLRLQNDPKALCFAAYFRGFGVEILPAAELGDAYAQARIASETTGTTRFRWAEKSAAQGERDGLFWLGFCFRAGFGCVKDVERAKEYFMSAALLGEVAGMVALGDLSDKNDPQRFVWLGKAAAKGMRGAFLRNLTEEVHSGCRNANVVFALGKALKGHIDNEKRTIFGEGYIFDARIGTANQAVQFYEFQLQSHRKAVDSWTIVALRNKVVKDIRKLIGKMIWDARDEAKYKSKAK
jgi:hypothetical protein